MYAIFNLEGPTTMFQEEIESDKYFCSFVKLMTLTNAGATRVFLVKVEL